MKKLRPADQILEKPQTPPVKVTPVTAVAKANNLIKVGNLEPGDTFEIPFLEGIMRNGVLLSTTSCSSRVSIEEFRDGKNSSGWHRTSDYISNSTEVRVTGSVELYANESGQISVKETEGANYSSETPRRRRGKRGPISFPTEKDFSVPGLAEELGCETHTVVNEMTRAKAAGGIFTVTRKEKNKSGRGRQVSFYKYTPSI